MNYGSWNSPITSEFITANQNKLAELGINTTKNEIYFVEGRPQEGGRQVVMSCRDGNVIDLNPPEINSRSRVHEYGGGSFCASNKKGSVVTVDFQTQDLVMVDGRETTRISEGSGGLYRFGDFVVDSTRENVIYSVYEDHTIDEPSKVVNSIVSVLYNASGDASIATLVNIEKDPRFLLASPRVDHTGRMICWVQWQLPSMPWSSSELWVGVLADDSRSIVSKSRVAGGERESVELPSWGPVVEDQASLFFISDQKDGWWSIYRTLVSMGGIQDGVENWDALCVLHSPGHEFGVPTWTLGCQQYDFLSDGRLFCLWNNEAGALCGVACVTDMEHVLSASGLSADSGLCVVEIPAVPSPADAETVSTEHLTSFQQLVVAAQDTVYLIAGSPGIPQGVFEWKTGDAFSSHVSGSVCPMGVLRLIRSSMANISLDLRYISHPRVIEFPTTVKGASATAFGNFYPPRNPECSAPSGALPPLLVKLHGGPTGQTKTVCRLDIQFFTSRGIAVLDVDYGGSTGYGREYRERLNGLWGVVDVEDCCRGAEYLASEGLVDREKLAIDGGSAGGFTTLACVTFRDTFKAATSSYGIGDLDALLHETHKFESGYLDSLIGPYPEMMSVYDERAPIKHVENLSCPLLLLQGADDRVVPPNQATMMYDAALAKQLPAALIMFEGEGHGFRKAENIQRAMNAELNFYGLIFGFEPDVKELVPLKNFSS